MLESRSQIVVRKGAAGDAKALAEVFGESWRAAYRGIIPHLHLENIVRRRDTNWWRNAVGTGDGLLVVEIAGVVAGYATFGRARSKGRFQGEIYELYLAPSHQGLGFGEYLFEGVRHALDMRRLDGLIVWALSENTQACEFYRRRGGRPVAKIVDTQGGAKLLKIGFGWT